MPLSRSKAIAEAIATVRARRSTTIVIALIAAAMTFATYLTAGQGAAAEAQLLSRIDEAGPRLITVTVADPDPGLAADAIARIAAVREAQWVLALGAATDVHNASPNGARANVAARVLLTPLPSLVRVSLGRTPHAGEAIVSTRAQSAMQLAEPSGAIWDGGTVRSVVGRYSASGVLGDLDRLVLIEPTNKTQVRATLLYVLADSTPDVDVVSRQIKAVSGVQSDHLQIQTSDDLIKLGKIVSGSVGNLGRQLAAGAIVAGMVLVSLTMILALNARRRDIGRRRALGASRSAIVALTVLEASVPVLGGVVLGSVVGIPLVAVLARSLPPWPFVAGAAVLIVIAGILAAVPPAAIAARQDPVRVLRVP